MSEHTRFEELVLPHLDAGANLARSLLRELEDLSYKEITRIADIPIGTAMSRLARARGLLQRSPLLQAMRGERAEVNHELR